MNAPAEPLNWTPPPLPSISTDEKKSSISVQPIEDLGLNSDNILAYKSVLLQDVASIKVPIGVGYASQLLPDLFDMKGLFTASAVGPVNDPKSARSKEKTWAFVGYPDMPPGRAIKGHRPARMLLCTNDIDTHNLSADEVQATVQKFYGEDTTAAIYSTASSRPEDKRWRVVVPLAQAIPTAEWLRLQAGFSETVAFLKGVEVDHSMDRATQISWGPNVPPDGRDADGVPLHFEHRFWGQVMFDPQVLTPTAVAMLEVVDELAAAEAQRQQELAVERDRKAAEREAARAEAIANGGEGLSAMERFKLEHTTESLLEKYGYEQNSRKPVEWRSPMQIASEQERIAKGTNSGATSYATKLNDDGSWTSVSETDAKAGIGRRSKGTQHGDAFDLFVFYEHKNDFKAAVAAAGQMYNIKPAAAQPSLSEFTALPVPVVMPPPVFGGFKGLANPFDRVDDGVSLRSNGDGKGWSPSKQNLKLALASGKGHRVAFDSFEGMVVIQDPGTTKWRPMKGTDATRVATAFEEAGFKPIPVKLMGQMLEYVADEHVFDSAQQWLESLPPWDGIPRVDSFLAKAFGTGEGPYQTAVSRYMWSGLAGRVIEPGVKAEMVVVLVSMQGVRKSASLAAMAPQKEWFAEIGFTGSADDKALYRRMRGKLVLEFAELDGLGKRAHGSLKRFLSSQADMWDEKYKEFETRYERRSLIFATTNEAEFLTDPTGHRRWLPVEAGTTGKAESDWISANRDQLWAEGAVLFKANGVLFADAERLAKAVHKNHEQLDPWYESLAEFVTIRGWEAGAGGMSPDPKPFTITEAQRIGIGLQPSQINRSTAMRAAVCLKSLGYVRVQRKTDTALREWVYVKSL